MFVLTGWISGYSIGCQYNLMIADKGGKKQ